MEIFHPFPSRVVVRVMPPCRGGLVIRLMFEMSEKNHFGYILFIGPESVGQASRDELLRSFDNYRSTYLMDYSEPRACFTGKITAEILPQSELIEMLRLFDEYHDVYPFRKGYGDGLREAIRMREDPEKYRATVEVHYDN